jgi:alcohol dehydrogenase class IV
MVILKNDPIPVIAIPTTAGTGSEVTHMAMATDKENNLKRLIKGPQLIPKSAVLDPTLLKSLPPLTISYTGIDAFTHALESFLSTRSTLITQQLSLGAIKLIYHALIPFKENPKDTELASKMLHGSCLAGIAFTNAELGAIHALASPIAGQYHLPHGLSCALLLCNVLKANRDAALEKYAILFETLGFSKNGLSDQKCADKLIEAIDELVTKLGILSSLKSLGIKPQVSPQMVEYVLKSPALTANPKKLNREEIESLFNSVC